MVSPKGYFPQDDTGLIIASMEGNADVSFEQMRALQIQAVDMVLSDKAVRGSAPPSARAASIPR